MVVDDSKHFAMAVSHFLAGEERFDVLPTAHTGIEALERAPLEQPDLMLLDVSMPGLNGLAVAARVKALAVPPKVVMMTLEDGEMYRDSAIAAGADGFLTKNDFARDLPRIVDSLFATAPRR
jgi:DNA-binding NarL/FixJ family response regulator